MAPTLIAALAVGMAAPIARAMAWGVPFGLLSVATVLRSFVGSAVTVLVVGTVAFYALRATPVPSEETETLAGAIGAIVGLGLLWSSVRRLRDVRGLSLLCQRLQEEDARPEAIAALDRLLNRVHREDPKRHVALVLMATGPLTQAGMWDEARRRLRDLDEGSLSEAQAVLRSRRPWRWPCPSGPPGSSRFRSLPFQTSSTT